MVGSIALAALSFWLADDDRLAAVDLRLIMLFVVYYLQDGIVGFVRSALNLQAADAPTRRSAGAPRAGADAVSTARGRRRRRRSC